MFKIQRAGMLSNCNLTNNQYWLDFCGLWDSLYSKPEVHVYITRTNIHQHADFRSEKYPEFLLYPILSDYTSLLCAHSSHKQLKSSRLWITKEFLRFFSWQYYYSSLFHGWRPTTFPTPLLPDLCFHRMTGLLSFYPVFSDKLLISHFNCKN